MIVKRVELDGGLLLDVEKDAEIFAVVLLRLSILEMVIERGIRGGFGLVTRGAI